MTEQEAKMFVQRSIRMWGIKRQIPSVRTTVRADMTIWVQGTPLEQVRWYLDTEWFHFRTRLEDNVLLCIDKICSNEILRFALEMENADGKIGGLMCKSEDGRIFLPKPEQSFTLLTAQWLPFFRRGCWLSGCPIESSAHERVEWMQGFTSEEVEAWDLKT